MRSILWWGGVALLLVAFLLFYFDLAPLSVAVGVLAGAMLLCLSSLVMEVRETGWSAEVVGGFANCLALTFGALGFFFHEQGPWVLVTAVCGALFFAFIGMFADFFGKLVDLRASWRRFRRWWTG